MIVNVCAMMEQQEHKIGVAEMWMLRWMCGHIRKDKIRHITK